MNKTRKQALIPNNVPRWIRVYDNMGATADRFTVCFTGKIRKKCGGAFPYLGMSSNPFHPQGFGQHGDSERQIDVNKWGFAPTFTNN